MNEDGMSYLDIGRQLWHGNWHSAVNGCWSPLYPWLIGTVIEIFHPSVKWEFPLVHLVNLAVLLAALFGFEFCWKEILRFVGHGQASKVGQAYLWASAYLLFIYVHLVFRDVALVTPDLIMAALTYVAAGLVLRIIRGQDMRSAALLGVVLGLGYLTKAPMFPFGLVVMFMLLFATRKRPGSVATVGVVLLIFIGIAAPLIATLSISNKRLTFGESARLNQAWYVNHVRPIWRHWQGSPSRPAQHPTRKVSEWPEAYEFGTPIPGTYPVWFDPTYWQAGIDASIHPRRELATFRANLQEYAAFALHDGGFLTIVLLLLLLSEESVWGCLQAIGAYWPILLPGIFMFTIYALVHWEPRYTSAFAAIFAVILLAVTSFGHEIRSSALLRGTALVLGMFVLYKTGAALADVRVEDWNASVQVDIAEDLKKLSIVPGEPVAIVGDGFSAYWAHLAQLRIVAEVPRGDQMRDSATAFWSSSASSQSKLLAVLERTGARAVLGSAPGSSLPPGWDAIGQTGLVVHVFPVRDPD